LQTFRFDIVHAQRVATDGTLPWGAAGLTIADKTGDQRVPVAIPDEEGGAYIAWLDTRKGDFDIYAQHVDATGAQLWTADGVAVSQLGSAENTPFGIAHGPGRVLLAWNDGRSPAGSDIYANSIDSQGGGGPTGGLAVDPPVHAGESAFLDPRPNPFATATRFPVLVATRGGYRLTVHDVAGRVVRRFPVRTSPGWLQETEWDGRDAEGALVPAGVYFVRLESHDGRITRRVVVRR
jgi:hypothetical protein